METRASQCTCGHETEEDKRAMVLGIIDEFKDQPGSLVQILHQVQVSYGYLPLEIQQLIAEHMDLPLSEVYGVSTFYSFFSTEPRGEHTIRVCMGTACYVRGSAKILKRLAELLNVEVGSTTKDRKFTLEVVRCMGACGLAPAISVDGEVVPQVNPDKLHRVLELCD